MAASKKKVASLTERVRKRAEKSKSTKWRYTQEIAAAKREIQATLNDGHTWQDVYDALRVGGEVTMSYKTFLAYCEAAEIIKPPGSYTKKKKVTVSDGGADSESSSGT